VVRWVTLVMVRDGDDDGWAPEWVVAMVLRWVGLVKGADLTEVRGPSTFDGLCRITYHRSFFLI